MQWAQFLEYIPESLARLLYVTLLRDIEVKLSQLHMYSVHITCFLRYLYWGKVKPAAHVHITCFHELNISEGVHDGKEPVYTDQ